MNKKVLVTGATGFLGSAVARKLLAHGGYQVRVLARPGSDRRNLADIDVEIVEGSLENLSSLKTALAGCSGLFHVAADYRIWVPKPENMMRANVEGTTNLLLLAGEAGIQRIVYTSSVAVLGHALSGIADEETPVSLKDMIGTYKKSKFLAEEKVRELIVKRSLPIVIVNPSMPVGPRDIKPTPTGRIIVEAASGKIPAFLDTGLNVVHVDDVADGHLLAFNKGKIGERYILGGDNWTLSDILSSIARQTGRSPPAIKLPRLPLFPLAMVAEIVANFTGNEPMLTIDGLRMAKWRMWFSSGKAERELGYSHRPAAEALGDSIRWFRQAGYL